MSSALMYFIIAGSNISFTGPTVAFPGTPSNPSIANNTIQIPSLTVNQPTSTPAPEIQTRRPGYTYASPTFGAHKYHISRLSWNAAREFCENEDSHLAIINSDDEAEAIVELLKKSGSHVSWIGAHDFYEEGKFVTIHGESLVKAGFNKWRTGQPDNFYGSENCVNIGSDIKLNDLNCADTHYFTCEVPYVP